MKKGASPLTRGKPTSVEAGVTGVGRIPAHAGKTIDFPGFQFEAEAHPRSRGENRLFRTQVE